MTAPTPDSHRLKGNRTAKKLQYDKHSFAFSSKRSAALHYHHTGQAGLRMERVIYCCLTHKTDTTATKGENSYASVGSSSSSTTRGCPRPVQIRS